MKIALVTWNAPERHARFVAEAHADMELLVVADSASDEEKAVVCEDADAVILSAATISPDVLRGCRKVKLLQGIGAGYDKIDVRAIAALGIPFANNGGSNAIPVAEHTIGMILSLSRGILRQSRNTKEGRWNQGLSEQPTWELHGKRIGLVGMGAIGSATARLLIGFGCETVYYKRSRLDVDLETQLHVHYVPFEELLATSDVISLHVALTPETRRLIGGRELELMKSSAILINTTRGEVIDERALYQALVDKQIAGAALDVLEQEPTPQDNPLLDLDNILITPHQSGLSTEIVSRAAAFAFANVRRAILGEPVQSLVVPADSNP